MREWVYSAGRRYGHVLRRHWRWLLTAVSFALMAAATPVLYATAHTRGMRYTDAAAVPHHRVAIIFGAGVLPDGQPTPYLQRRIETGVALLQAGKVDMLLMSGDNRTSHYNEPVGMGKYAERLGVPHDRIVLDYAGYSTYDTCYRAQAIFGLHDAVLVTHGYHLPRAVTTCNRLGVRSVGLAAMNASTVGKDVSPMYLVREVLSVNKSVPELLLRPRPAVLGFPEPIN